MNLTKKEALINANLRRLELLIFGDKVEQEISFVDMDEIITGKELLEAGKYADPSCVYFTCSCGKKMKLSNMEFQKILKRG